DGPEGAKSDDPAYPTKWWEWTKKQAIFARIWHPEQDFKDCKMIYNTLNGLGVWKECCSFWGEKVKFEDSAMEHRSIIINLCYFTRLIDNFFLASLGRETCAELVMAALPFFTPLTSDTFEETSAGALVAHWAFDQSGKEFEMLMDNLKYDLTESATHKKMKKLAESASDKSTELQEQVDELKEDARQKQALADRPQATKKQKAEARKAAMSAVKAAQKLELSSKPVELHSWAETVEVKSGPLGLGVWDQELGSKRKLRGVSACEDYVFHVRGMLDHFDKDGVGENIKKSLRRVAYNLMYRLLWKKHRPGPSIRGKAIEKYSILRSDVLALIERSMQLLPTGEGGGALTAAALADKLLEDCAKEASEKLAEDLMRGCAGAMRAFCKAIDFLSETPLSERPIFGMMKTAFSEAVGDRDKFDSQGRSDQIKTVVPALADVIDSHAIKFKWAPAFKAICTAMQDHECKRGSDDIQAINEYFGGQSEVVTNMMDFRAGAVVELLEHANMDLFAEFGRCLKEKGQLLFDEVALVDTFSSRAQFIQLWSRLLAPRSTGEDSVDVDVDAIFAAYVKIARDYATAEKILDADGKLIAVKEEPEAEVDSQTK
ncbi:unnamed protein product, partial [Prorocentrum cordatum]